MPCGADAAARISARTVARVEQTAGIEAGYGPLVQPHLLRLAHHWPVPVEPEGTEVGELCAFHARTNTRAVEVLHAYEKPGPGRTSEQPRQESGPQVSEMERASRARREASVGDVLLPVLSEWEV